VADRVVAFGGGVLAVGQGLRASSSHSRPTAGSLSGDHAVSLHGLDDEAIGVEGRELRPFLWPPENYAPSASATIAPVRKLVLPTATIAFHAARSGGSRFANAAVVKSSVDCLPSDCSAPRWTRRRAAPEARADNEWSADGRRNVFRQSDAVGAANAIRALTFDDCR